MPYFIRIGVIKGNRRRITGLVHPPARNLAGGPLGRRGSCAQQRGQSRPARVGRLDILYALAKTDLEGGALSTLNDPNTIPVLIHEYTVAIVDPHSHSASALQQAPYQILVLLGLRVAQVFLCARFLLYFHSRVQRSAPLRVFIGAPREAGLRPVS